MSVPKRIVALIDAKNEEILRLEAEKAEMRARIEALIQHLQECMSKKTEAQQGVERLKDQYENVSKHYSRRGEDIERLEAEKAEILEALEYAIAQVPELASVPGIEAAIRKARGEE